jgi:hypothetical protein
MTVGDSRILCHLVDRENSDNLIIPGTLSVGGVAVGGSGATLGSYALLYQTNITAVAGNGDSAPTLSSLYLAGSDFTFSMGARDQLTVVNHGIYRIQVLGSWNIGSGQTGSRMVKGTPSGVDPATTVGFGAMIASDLVSIGAADDDDHLHQVGTGIGEVAAGTVFTFRYRNGDSVNNSTLSAFEVFATRLA